MWPFRRKAPPAAPPALIEILKRIQSDGALRHRDPDADDPRMILRLDDLLQRRFITNERGIGWCLTDAGRSELDRQHWREHQARVRAARIAIEQEQ